VQRSISRIQSSGCCRASSKKDIESSNLVEFIVEVVCFKFPEHIGTQAEIGPNGLDLRKRFGVNLVGIERPSGNEGERDVEWFPLGTSTVDPGSPGLVVRKPCADGSSRPTLADEDLAPPPMQKELFARGRSQHVLVCASLWVRVRVLFVMGLLLLLSMLLSVAGVCQSCHVGP